MWHTDKHTDKHTDIWASWVSRSSRSRDWKFTIISRFIIIIYLQNIYDFIVFIIVFIVLFLLLFLQGLTYRWQMVKTIQLSMFLLQELALRLRGNQGLSKSICKNYPNLMKGPFTMISTWRKLECLETTQNWFRFYDNNYA